MRCFDVIVAAATAVILSQAGGVMGFSASSSVLSYNKKSLLKMATSTIPPSSSSSSKNNDWVGKPIPRKGEKTTKPIPSGGRTVSWLERQTMDDVMIEPDYLLTIGVALLGPLIIWYHPSYMADGSPSLIGVAGGIFHLLFASLLWVQTRRVRCVFEKDAFEFYNIKGPALDFEKGAWLQRKPLNYVSKTTNRWKYDSIINYGYYPSKQFPVICYFKEIDTPPEKWNRWFAAFDSYQNGQPHFFPGICNVDQFDEQMKLRGVSQKPFPTFSEKK